MLLLLFIEFDVVGWLVGGERSRERERERQTFFTDLSECWCTMYVDTNI